MPSSTDSGALPHASALDAPLSEPCAPAADWEEGVADAIAAFAARVEHWNDHPGDLDDTGPGGLFVDPDQPDPMLDAAYRSGIVTPEQRLQTTVANVQVAVTFFPDRYAYTKTEMILPLGSLVELTRTTRAREKKGLPLLKLAQLGSGRTDKGSVRFDENIVAISGVECDYDAEKVSIEEAIEIAAKAGLLCIIYTSPSHAPEKPRWRILCPTSREFPPDQRGIFLARVNGLYSGIFAAESWTLSQSYYFGCVRNETHRVGLIDGQPIDLLHCLDRIAIAESCSEKGIVTKPVKPVTGLSPYAETRLDKACRKIIEAPPGEQERTLNAQAFSIGRLAGAGAIPNSFAHNALVWAARKMPDHDPRRPWRVREIERKVDRAFNAGLRHPREARFG